MKFVRGIGKKCLSRLVQHTFDYFRQYVFASYISAAISVLTPFGDRTPPGYVCRSAFETMLNETWSGACLVGQWISFDEQMVLCVGRTAKFMLRYMPKKPIKNGG